MPSRPDRENFRHPDAGESPDAKLIVERDGSHWCDWHDVLLICNSVGLFCVGVILLVVLILLIVWRAHS